MDDSATRLRRIRTLALPLAALAFVVMLLSVYLRLDYAGLGCADWPACYGQLLSEGPRPHTGFIRALHRITASAALVLTIIVVWRSLRPQPLQPVARNAVLLLLLMLFLSVIGILSADPHRVVVSFLNILGGLGLVSFSWRVLQATRPAPTAGSPAHPDPALHPGLLVLTASMILGALIGARYAAVTCASLPDCGGTWWPAGSGWAALNPFVHLAAAPAAGEAGGVALHLLHRYFAVATLLLLGTAAIRALPNPATRSAARVLLLLLALAVALGMLSVASDFKLWLTVAHSASAATLLAAVVQLQLAARLQMRAD